MRMAVTRVAASTPRGCAGRGNKRRQCRGIACAEGNCAVELVAAGVATRQTRTAETFGLRNGPHVNLVLNDVELPTDYDSRRGAAILACRPGRMNRLGSRGFVRIGQVR